MRLTPFSFLVMVHFIIASRRLTLHRCWRLLASLTSDSRRQYSFDMNVGRFDELLIFRHILPDESGKLLG